MNATATIVLLGLACAAIADRAVAQGDRRLLATGALTVTNKGISTLPALTLGKPAGIVDVAIGRNGWSFAPQFRWALEGKPWSFIFWGRYRFPTHGRWHLAVGAHPAIVFKTIDSVIVARRYFAGEIGPGYTVTRHLDVVLYYFYSKGIDKESIQNTHMGAARVFVNTGPFAGNYVLQFAPQLYYLTMDGDDGVYLASTLTIGHRTVPLAISTFVNEPLRSDLAGGQEFIWNVSLIYTFR